VTDQIQYSNGSSQAYLMGRNYGIDWRADPSQTCFIYRPDGDQILPGGTSGGAWVGGDYAGGGGGSPFWVNYVQQGSYHVQKILYQGVCGAVLNPFSVTALWRLVVDSVDTGSPLNANIAPADITNFTTTARWPPAFSPMGMPPVSNESSFTAQTARFQSRMIDYTSPRFIQTGHGFHPRQPAPQVVCALLAGSRQSVSQA
jgi:hypothetical protein